MTLGWLVSLVGGLIWNDTYERSMEWGISTLDP
jgi:hypothetical protein